MDSNGRPSCTGYDIGEDMNDIRLIHGDCLEVMKTFADGEFDTVVTSPPYNMRTRIRNGQYTTREWGSHFSIKYSSFHDALPIDDYYRFHSKALHEMLRLAAIVFVNIQIVTGSKEAWFQIIGDFAKQIKDVIVWDKGEGQPAMHPAVLNSGYELILILEANTSAGRAFTKSYFERGTMSNIWRLGRGGNGSIKGHGAIFPESLANRIITGWTIESDHILDPFGGSGTTAVACVKTGRRCTSIEIDEDYHAISVKRVAEAQAQPRLI